LVIKVKNRATIL